MSKSVLEYLSLPKSCCIERKLYKKQEGHYSLEPYYLIFMGENNEVKLGFSNAKQILDTYKKLCLGEKHGIQEAIALFEAKTKNYNDMSFL